MTRSKNRNFPAMVICILITSSAVHAAVVDGVIHSTNPINAVNGGFPDIAEVGNTSGGTLQLSTGTIHINSGPGLTTWGGSSSTFQDYSASNLGQYANAISIFTPVGEPVANGIIIGSLDYSSTSVLNISGLTLSGQRISEPASADLSGLSSIVYISGSNTSPQSIPEPASLGLLAIGAVILLQRKSRRASKSEHSRSRGNRP